MFTITYACHKLGVLYLHLAWHPCHLPLGLIIPPVLPVALDEKVGSGVMFFKVAELQRWP